jgi:hypothetical protein
MQEPDEMDRAWYVQSLRQDLENNVGSLGPVKAAAETLQSASDEERDSVLIQLLNGADREAILAYGRGQRWDHCPCGYYVGQHPSKSEQRPSIRGEGALSFHPPEKPVCCAKPLGDAGVAWLESRVYDNIVRTQGIVLGHPELSSRNDYISASRNKGTCGMWQQISTGEAYQYKTWYCQQCSEECVELWRQAIIRQGLLPNDTIGLHRGWEEVANAMEKKKAM